MVNRAFQFFIPLLGAVVLVQVLTLTVSLHGKKSQMTAETQVLRKMKEQLDTELAKWNRNLDLLRKDTAQVNEMVQADFLAGHEDHEPLLTSFMDFAQTTFPSQLEVKIKTPEPLRYVAKPTPHHETDITFLFQPEDIDTTVSFLTKLFGQKRFPLKIVSLDIQRSSGLEIKGKLHVVLLVPTRHRAILSATHSGGRN